MPPLAEPVPLDDVGRKAFASYAPSRSYEKAFATDAAGHYGETFGQRTKADAEQAALKNCERMERVCTVYAIDNDLMSAGAKPEVKPGK